MPVNSKKEMTQIRTEIYYANAKLFLSVLENALLIG